MRSQAKNDKKQYNVYEVNMGPKIVNKSKKSVRQIFILIDKV